MRLRMYGVAGDVQVAIESSHEEVATPIAWPVTFEEVTRRVYFRRTCSVACLTTSSPVEFKFELETCFASAVTPDAKVPLDTTFVCVRSQGRVLGSPRSHQVERVALAIFWTKATAFAFVSISQRASTTWTTTTLFNQDNLAKSSTSKILQIASIGSGCRCSESVIR